MQLMMQLAQNPAQWERVHHELGMSNWSNLSLKCFILTSSNGVVSTI